MANVYGIVGIVGGVGLGDVGGKGVWWGEIGVGGWGRGG